MGIYFATTVMIMMITARNQSDIAMLTVPQLKKVSHNQCHTCRELRPEVSDLGPVVGAT